MHHSIISIPVFYGTIAFYHLALFTKKKKYPGIKARIPSTIYIFTVGNVLSTVILWINLCTAEGDCHLVTFAKYTIYVTCVPVILRGIHYWVFYKGKELIYPLIMGRNFFVSIIILFSVFHYSIMEIFYWNLPYYRLGNCSMSWDGLYIGFLTIILIVITSILAFNIPGSFDSFNVGFELKICLFLWGSLGMFALAIEFFGNFVFLGYEWQAATCLVLIMNTFLLIFNLIVPLYSKEVDMGNVKIQDSEFSDGIIIVAQKRRIDPKARKRMYVKGKFTPSVDPIEEDDETEEESISAHKCDESVFPLIFDCKEATSNIHQVARKLFTQKNTLFLAAVHDYKHATKKFEPVDRFSKYKEICSSYISIDAPHQLDLSSRTCQHTMHFIHNRDSFTSAEDSTQLDIFSLAEEEIRTILMSTLTFKKKLSRDKIILQTDEF
mmetsp:Transcript_17021/g.21402  ORF Transcript_17021/g.21402 Transcript_17021/m.21402 type:complete len:437 (+) Transcript_17021:147-1457(+)